MSNVSIGPFYAINGVVAGCSMATTFFRIYVIPVIDPLELPRPLLLDIYIDDYGVSSTGSESSVSVDLKEVASTHLEQGGEGLET